MKIYYAHAVNLYGTPQEKRDIELLESLGFEVENPNQKRHAKAYAKRGMNYFHLVISKCDALAFRALPDNTIPAGIVKEIWIAQSYNYPVIELPSSILRRGLTIDQTREYLTEIGDR